MKTGIKVGDAMTFNPVTVPPTATLRECAQVMEKNHVGSLLIKDKDKLVGIVTEQDMVRKGLGKISRPEKAQIKDVMRESIYSVGPEEDIADALQVMNDYNIRHLPVMHKGKFVGLITGKDILKIQPHLFETLAEKIELREGERKLKAACQTCGE